MGEGDEEAERLFRREFELKASQPFTPLAGAVFCGNSVIVNAVLSAYGNPGLAQDEVRVSCITAVLVKLGTYAETQSLICQGRGMLRYVALAQEVKGFLVTVVGGRALALMRRPIFWFGLY